MRVGEVYDSIEMILFWLDNLPGGKILTESWTYRPHAFGAGFTEAPRGEDMHWSMTGDNQKCYRWRAKASTYSNWPVLRYMLRGNTVSDAAVIVGSIDPCYSCTDRVTIVDMEKRKQITLNREEFEDGCRKQSTDRLLGR